MSWIEKERTTAFESLPIEGLLFLDGDVVGSTLAEEYRNGRAPSVRSDEFKGLKLALVEFPSRELFPIWEASNVKFGGIVHIFGEMDLPIFDTREEAWERANDIADQVAYLVFKRGEDSIQVVGHDEDEHFLIAYDDAARRIKDIRRLPWRSEDVRASVLSLDEATRERLPKLYANEALGENALAQVKFFTPDSNWTWYASEFDGDDIFFGLVIGYEIEYGYFSLSELSEMNYIRGGSGLPIERDRFFAPKTLGELKRWHEQQRGER